MVAERECQIDIAKWAKETNQFVNGLNYSFNGEDYNYNSIDYLENKTIASISVTKHLFAETDFIHLTMTLGLRIIIDTITNHLSNKYSYKLKSVQIKALHSINIERIAHLTDIGITVEETDFQYLGDNYSGSFTVTFDAGKMIFDVSVSCRIKQANIGLIRSENIKTCYENYRLDISNMLVEENHATSVPIVFKDNQECNLADVPFPIVFNLLINNLFIYCSHDSNLKGSRFILATNMHITQDIDTLLTAPIYLVMNNKKYVKSRILYETVLKDKHGKLQFEMKFLYQVNIE